MVMEFLNDPGNGWYRASPDGHVWMTPTKFPEPPVAFGIIGLIAVFAAIFLVVFKGVTL
jgi:hypothetical protein